MCLLPRGRQYYWSNAFNSLNRSLFLFILIPERPWELKCSRILEIYRINNRDLRTSSWCTLMVLGISLEVYLLSLVRIWIIFSLTSRQYNLFHNKLWIKESNALYRSTNYFFIFISFHLNWMFSANISLKIVPLVLLNVHPDKLTSYLMSICCADLSGHQNLIFQLGTTNSSNPKVSDLFHQHLKLFFFTTHHSGRSFFTILKHETQHHPQTL